MLGVYVMRLVLEHVDKMLLLPIQKTETELSFKVLELNTATPTHRHLQVSRYINRSSRALALKTRCKICKWSCARSPSRCSSGEGCEKRAPTAPEATC